MVRRDTALAVNPPTSTDDVHHFRAGVTDTPAESTTLQVEVDTVWTGPTSHSLGSALTPALLDGGLPSTISFT